MYFQYKLVFILILVGGTHGSGINISVSTSCNDTVVQGLDECWKPLSSATINGIPSSPQKIKDACILFISGMECVDNWSRTCLSKAGQEKIESSITGAIQLYSLLCTNTDFQEEYLKHANCYQRISPSWDVCNTKFSNTLKRIDHARDTLSLCCVRIRYNQCLNHVTKVLCSDAANDFLQSITDSLMHSPMQEYQSSQCINVTPENCSSSSSADSSPKFLMISYIPVCNVMLNSFKKLMLALFAICHVLGLNNTVVLAHIN